MDIALPCTGDFTGKERNRPPVLDIVIAKRDVVGLVGEPFLFGCGVVMAVEQIPYQIPVRDNEQTTMMYSSVFNSFYKSANQVFTKAEASKDNSSAITVETDIENALNASVFTTMRGGMPGQGANMLINGITSLNTTTQPLIVVDGVTLATGTAYEEKGSSYINKTSHVENCETSAVGRALGFLGIGIDESMASADEVANAICQQNELKAREKAKELISAIEYKALLTRCNTDGVDVNKLCEAYKISGLEELTKGQHAGIHKGWETVVKNCKQQES